LNRFCKLPKTRRDFSVLLILYFVGAHPGLDQGNESPACCDEHDSANRDGQTTAKTLRIA